MTAKAHHIGPHSRLTALRKLDKRTIEVRYLEKTRDQLLAHLGGQASAVQVAMIERAAWLSLRLAQLDQKVVKGTFAESDSAAYLSWSNSLTRLLARLGIERAERAAVVANPYRQHQEMRAAE